MKIISLLFVLGSTQAVNLRKPASVENVQLEEHKIQEMLPDFHGYTVGYSGFVGNGQWKDGYERVVPEHFADEIGDTFTRHMIEEFAQEGQDKDTGKPNGKFFMDKSKVKAATYEVLGTHLNIKGAEAEKYLAKYFEPTFEHFDVNHVGFLDVIEMNKFMRYLCKPVKEHIILE